MENIGPPLTWGDLRRKKSRGRTCDRSRGRRCRKGPGKQRISLYSGHGERHRHCGQPNGRSSRQQVNPKRRFHAHVACFPSYSHLPILLKLHTSAHLFARNTRAFLSGNGSFCGLFLISRSSPTLAFFLGMDQQAALQARPGQIRFQGTLDAHVERINSKNSCQSPRAIKQRRTLRRSRNHTLRSRAYFNGCCLPQGGYPDHWDRSRISSRQIGASGRTAHLPALSL